MLLHQLGQHQFWTFVGIRLVRGLFLLTRESWRYKLLMSVRLSRWKWTLLSLIMVVVWIVILKTQSCCHCYSCGWITILRSLTWIGHSIHVSFDVSIGTLFLLIRLHQHCVLTQNARFLRNVNNRFRGLVIFNIISAPTFECLVRNFRSKALMTTNLARDCH